MTNLFVVIDGGPRDGEPVPLPGDRPITLTVRFHSLRDKDVILRHRTAAGIWEEFLVHTDADGFATIVVYELGPLLASVRTEDAAATTGNE